MKRLNNEDIIDNLHCVYRNDVDNVSQESFNKLRDIEEEIKLRIKNESNYINTYPEMFEEMK